MSLKASLLIAKKDLKIEFRSRQTLSFMFLFSFLILLIFNFSAEPETMKKIAPAVLWLVFIFAGMLGLSRAFIKEKELGTLEGLKLAPISGAELLLGKIAYNLVLMFAIEAITFPVFIALFNYRIAGSTIDALFVLAIGSIGFVVVGSFMSALIMSARSRELVLQVVALPMLVPVIIPTVLALNKIMAQGTKLAAFSGTDVVFLGEVKLIIGYMLIMAVLSLMLFEYVMEE